ncbi:xanthine dehydrogenase accessory protein XdhC [Pleomorphomonas sp. PLEO]|uniref:xanthine dehydrogenase accessory protein XdhC n=1 Tax=Pleomorphomonas sp. PLEO TaxID=3239306 RepID=UPI00351DB19E
MRALFATLIRLVERDGSAALVTVSATHGSAPREAGARVVVARGGAISGTIGGGRLEHEAIQRALQLMEAGRDATELMRLALGPSLGQCCGGDVTLVVEVFGRSRLDQLGDLARAEARGPFQTLSQLVDGVPMVRAINEGQPAGNTVLLKEDGTLLESFGSPLRDLLLFGAGHVGKALVLALAPLPFSVRWIDSRPEMFPNLPFANLNCVVSDQPAAEAARAPDGAFVIIMTHDHGLDLNILDAALRLNRLPYVGLIGSATKRTRFEHRLKALGHSEAHARSFVCPIGIPGILSKEPAVIAASVAADLLLQDQKVRDMADQFVA